MVSVWAFALVVVVSLLVGALLALWRASQPRAAVLGSTDLSYEASRALAWSVEGSRLVLEAMDGEAEVILTRRGSDSGTDPLHVWIRSTRPHRPDAAALLTSFGLEIELRQVDARFCSLDASGPLPDREVAGGLVDALLHVAGLMDGERFRYRFEGQWDADAMRRYRLGSE